MFEDDAFDGEQAPRPRRKPNKMKHHYRRDRDGHGGKRGVEYVRSREKDDIRQILDEWEDEQSEDLADDEDEEEDEEEENK
jgi:hypothetical protein